MKKKKVVLRLKPVKAEVINNKKPSACSHVSQGKCQLSGEVIQNPTLCNCSRRV